MDGGDIGNSETIFGFSKGKNTSQKVYSSKDYSAYSETNDIF